MRVVIGIDPDTQKHGVAIYENGELTKLQSMARVDIEVLAKHYQVAECDLIFSIEDVCSQNFLYRRNEKAAKGLKEEKIKQQMMRKTGANQQSQRELMASLDHLGIPYKLYKPTRANFGKNKALFEKATKWTGRSNPDTRSAAYFGFLEAKRK